MKHIFILSFLLVTSPIFAQTIPVTIKAIGEGNVAALTPLFDETVEISINDVPDLYSRKEARVKLNSFFTNNKPISFTRKHEGDSKGKDSQYIIGVLRTTNKSLSGLHLFR